jgi:CO/xanthine dehydrogenase Mo-binding subunit
VLAGAVGNAIAALTGVRLHELPFAPEQVRGALGA